MKKASLACLLWSSMDYWLQSSLWLSAFLSFHSSTGMYTRTLGYPRELVA